MATYKDIQADVRKWSGRAVQTCWIAHVKEINGLTLRKASNRICTIDRNNPCPAKVRPLIEASMVRLGILNRT